MDKTFASALRNSRLASFDRKLAQVYTTSKNCKRGGEWGLKRNLPSVIRTPYITVTDLDTNEHQTPWQSGSSQVLFIRRWKENFPLSKRPLPRNEQKEYNISSMTPAQFKQFIKQASKKATEFHEKLKSNDLVQDQVFEFLGATFDNNYNKQEVISSSQGENKVGPTYSDYQQSDMGYPVQGRILGSVEGGYAVGVGGVIAFLPKRMALNIKRTGDRSVRTFYVQHAGFDKEGRPRVTLRLHQPISATSLINSRYQEKSSPNQQVQQDNNNNNPFRSMRAEDMFLTSNSGINDENEQEFDPNPNHAALMEMMSRLVTDKK
ncbi:hypothetical protein BDC45DRAFT_521374 [Circinella umbellata]|nr:hypothetical protein BDC45DRAFT_521374 [Circinella umbellata]